MESEVPDGDARGSHNPSPQATPTIEERLLVAGLDREAREQGFRKREADQRYWLKWLAVAVVVAAILGMACFLRRLPHDAHIALYIAPIVSISTLTIALLISAFRGFKDGDEKMGTSIASDAVKAAKFIPN